MMTKEATDDLVKTAELVDAFTGGLLSYFDENKVPAAKQAAVVGSIMEKFAGPGDYNFDDLTGVGNLQQQAVGGAQDLQRHQHLADLAGNQYMLRKQIGTEHALRDRIGGAVNTLWPPPNYTSPAGAPTLVNQRLERGAGGSALPPAMLDVFGEQGRQQGAQHQIARAWDRVRPRVNTHFPYGAPTNASAMGPSSAPHQQGSFNPLDMGNYPNHPNLGWALGGAAGGAGLGALASLLQDPGVDEHGQPRSRHLIRNLLMGALLGGGAGYLGHKFGLGGGGSAQIPGGQTLGPYGVNETGAE